MGTPSQFYFRTTDVTGAAQLAGAEMALPGDNVRMEVTLDKPIAVESSARFALREGSRTIGRGVVTSVWCQCMTS